MCLAKAMHVDPYGKKVLVFPHGMYGPLIMSVRTLSLDSYVNNTLFPHGRYPIGSCSFFSKRKQWALSLTRFTCF